MSYDTLVSCSRASMTPGDSQSQTILVSSFQHERMIALLTSLFNTAVRPSEENAQVRGLLSKTAPLVQYFVIELLGRLFDFEVESLRVCREVNMWDTLYSDHFYYWGMNEKASEKRQLGNLLRSAVLKLTVYAGSLTLNTKNIEQIQALLNLIEKNQENEEIVYQAGDCFFKLLQAKGTETRQSLVHLDCQKILTGLLEKVYFFFSSSSFLFFSFISIIIYL
jgi:hypothetical protein